jgi:branched-chain amino acid transport system permease protein
MNRFGALTLAIVLLAALVLPNFLKGYGIYLMSMWAVLSIAAMGLNLTLGYAGQVSLAQGAFVGIGAYTAALMMKAGVPYPLCFVSSGLVCFTIGWLLGYPALRVQHHYLAFVTLAFTTLVYLIFRNEEWLTGGTYGLSGIDRPSFFGLSTNGALGFFYFSFGIMVLLTAATWWMLHSPWGRAFDALRENPVRALSLGLDTRR